jgi:NMD protein affecting ribosome stability and mRNA decay
MNKKTSHQDYFEAIIQLRPATQELLHFIKKRVDEREGVFISKIEELKKIDGVDIYISSQKYAQTIGRKLKKSFKGELKLSRTLHTQDKMSGKRIYRLTVLFRLKPKES